MACLDDATVQALLDGTAEAKVVAEADAHVADCAECRELLSTLARENWQNTDEGAALMRGPTVRAPGVVVLGRYQLERLIGEGGMGQVWAGKHLITKRPVALKFVSGIADERDRRRLFREARAQGAIDHPNVVQVHDILELEDGSPVIVMDLLRGESLRETLDRDGALPADRIARILVPVISALGAAHALGIVHRDLKPDNLFLVTRPDGSVDVKVLDFGVAKLTATTGDAMATRDAMTGTGEVLGTPHYMSPEQAFGEADLDQRADIWALGVVLYEALAGERPFRGDNLGQLLKAVITGAHDPLAKRAPSAPAELAALVEQMLSVDRNARPADLHAVLAVVSRFTDATAKTFGRPRFWRARTTSSGVIVSALVMAALTLAIAWWQSQRAPAAPAPAQVTPLVAAPQRPALQQPDAAIAQPSMVEPARPSRPKLPPPKTKLPGGVVDQVPF